MSSKKHLLFVVSSPSGGGKSTLVAALLEQVPGTRLSVSHTTRAPRPHEVEGREYHFVDYSQFKLMRDRDEFLEWAEVFGELYGTSRKQVDDLLAAGYDVVLDIDVHGAEQIRRALPDAITIFIMPPSFSILKGRLIDRGTETPSALSRRLEMARQEVTRFAEFHYVVINNELEEACKAVESIVRAERQRRFRQEEQARVILETFQQG